MTRHRVNSVRAKSIAGWKIGACFAGPQLRGGEVAACARPRRVL